MMNLKTLFSITLFLLVSNISAQEFSSQVERFITINENSYVITNVTVIDGTGNATKANQSIIINNKKIEAIGDANSIKVPEGITIIDGTNKTIIPGLVMLHEHMFYTKPFENWFSVGQMTFTFPRLYLAGGVTTMRTGGSIQPQTDLNVRKWINEGKMTGPKMFVTGHL